ncbi:hypothetical protein Syun_018516 [Stephania yunnanensis]|uniref:Uncharacterized protein n=1 Tax=Stephania yunnanensis TaxID=152371 RepID=A0AAP0ISE9_9MAGN
MQRCSGHAEASGGERWRRSRRVATRRGERCRHGADGGRWPAARASSGGSRSGSGGGRPAVQVKTGDTAGE